MDEFTQHTLLTVTLELAAMVAGVAIEWRKYKNIGG